MWDLLIVIIPGAFTTVLTIGAMHDMKKGPWNPRRKWGPQHKQLLKAKTALLDMSEFKKQRRIEDRQKWATEFEQLSGPGEDLEPAPATPTVDERMRQLWKERDGQRRQETIIRNADGETIVVLPSGGIRVEPRITHSSEVPRPQPPRGGGGVSSPRATVNTPAMVIRTVAGEDAYLVRMGKFAGHYVVRHDDYDSLLDRDRLTILEQYEDGHYSTCPYECDCPKWAKRY